MSSSPAKKRLEPAPYKLVEFESQEPQKAEPQEPAKAEPAAGSEVFELLFAKGQGGDALSLAQNRAEQIEAAAKDLKDQAQQELEQAKTQAEEIRKQAYEEGYAQGVEEGKAAASAQVTAALDNLTRTLERLDTARASLLSDMEAELVAVVQATFDRLCLSKEAIAPDLVRNLVRTAVTRLPDSEEITVRVSPADLSLVQEFKPSIMRELEDLKRLRVQVDEKLHPGDCVVESSIAQVDATLATRRERVSRTLDEALRHGDPIPVEELGNGGAAPRAEGGETDEAQAQADGGDEWEPSEELG